MINHSIDLCFSFIQPWRRCVSSKFVKANSVLMLLQQLSSSYDPLYTLAEGKIEDVRYNIDKTLLTFR